MIYGKTGNTIGAQVQTTWGNVELCLHSTRISRCVSASMAPRCRPFAEVSIVKFICLYIPMACKVIRTLYFLKVNRTIGFLGNGDIGKKKTPVKDTFIPSPITCLYFLCLYFLKIVIFWYQALEYKRPKWVYIAHIRAEKIKWIKERVKYIFIKCSFWIMHIECTQRKCYTIK